jgi:hypothetical protein
MGKDDKPLAKKSSRSEIDAFVKKLAANPAAKPAGRRGRLIFAMDATASREPAWDQACHIQAEMFNETARLGGLEIQLCWFRGYKEFHASPWTTDSQALLREMTSVSCQAGHTQIGTVLRHAIDETRASKVNALVFVGDCMEEDHGGLLQLGGELGLLGLPAFVFQEGDDPIAAHVFREIARLSRGAYCAFDAASPRQLRDLLGAVAVYAAGGRKALSDYSRRTDALVRRITHQIDKG